MQTGGKILMAAIATVMLLAADAACYGQSSHGRRRAQAPPPPREDIRRFQVVGGVIRDNKPQTIADSIRNLTGDPLRLRDSLMTEVERLRSEAHATTLLADSIAAASPDEAAAIESLRMQASQALTHADSLHFESETLLRLHDVAAAADSLRAEPAERQLSQRERRREERAAFRADTSTVRYSRLFRDTIPLSRMTAISLVVPGFAQLHNKQAWKIPVLYATAGTSLYFGLIQNNYYRQVRKQYDDRIRYGYDRETSDLDAVQTSMIRYNTRRQLLFGAMLVSYFYFLGDGVVNHPAESLHVKKATTLSTIIPGAGQIYNKSYWKVPIVMGSFATMAYIVDWNNRGYKRFKLAYDIVTDGNPNTHSEFWDGYREMLTAENLANYRKAYRRNRDLAIILTGAVYLVQLIDSHVDAHMKNFDIGDDLSFEVKPSMTNLYTSRTGSVNMVGLNLNFKF